MAANTQKNKKRRGFTLIELMGVILLIALLLTITMAAVNRLMKAAKEKRIQIMKNTLSNVILRYYEDYGRWPVTLTPAQLNGDTLRQGSWEFGRNYQSIADHTSDDIWEEFKPDLTKEYTDAGIMYGGTPQYIGGTHIGGDNNLLLESLLRDSANNEKNITYLDETGFFCCVNREIVKLSERKSAGPWCFRDVDGKIKSFKVVLRPIDKTVMVGTGDEIK